MDLSVLNPSDALPVKGMLTVRDSESEKREFYNIRTYDIDGFRRRAGCICFKNENRKEVLLISSSKHTGQDWRLPAGGIEPNEEVEKCALRETLEEAGAIGNLVKPVGVIEDQSNRYRTTLFLFIVTDLIQYPDWEEGNRRERRWFIISEAIQMLAKRPLCQSVLKRITMSENSP